MTQLYDEQRVTLIDTFGPLSQEKPYQQNATIQRIAKQWQAQASPLRESVEMAKNNVQVRSLAEQDEMVDASVRAMDAGLFMQEQLAIARDDETLHAEITATRQYVLPHGTSPITYAPYETEIGMVADLLTRCKEPKIALQLKKLSLDEIVTLTEQRNDEMRVLLDSSGKDKSAQQARSKALKDARRNFDEQLARLEQYVESAYDADIPEEAALQERFLVHIRAAKAAAEAERQRRSKERADKKKKK